MSAAAFVAACQRLRLGCLKATLLESLTVVPAF